MIRHTQNTKNIHEWASHIEFGDLGKSDPHFFPINRQLG